MRLGFLDFELDLGRRELSEHGRRVPIPPKAFDVLAYLVERRDRMVPKRELLETFWSSDVSEAALQKALGQIRKAVGGAGGGAPVVRTYHGRGVRFVAETRELIHAAEAAASLAPAPPPTLAERRLVTVLSIRLPGAARRPRLTEAQRTSLEAFMATSREVVERHRGALLTATLDGFTASFGLDEPVDDGARRAVYCARALVCAAPPEARDASQAAAGIDIGRVELAGPEAADRWMPPGEIERGAMALSDAAREGEILLSDAARNQVREEVETEAAEAGFRLLSAGPMRAGIPGRPRKRPTRFVGRSAEMAFLRTHLAALAGGTGQAVTLSGPAGIGKTRLVSEFAGALDPEAVRVVRLQCLPGLSDTPMAPVREMCLALFPAPPKDAVRDEIDAALLGEMLDDVAPGAPALQALSDRARRQRRLALLARMLAAVALTTPLLIVVEDVHWIDATSRDYLEALLEGVDGMRLMVLLTSRPGRGSDMTESVLRLSPLGRRESLSLLAELCGEDGIGDEAAQALVGRAAGNPFFIEELALAAQSGGDPAVDLPDTVQAVTAVRIGELEPGLRSLVYVLAATGPPAPPSLVAPVLGLPVEEVEAALRRLVEMGFVQAGTGGHGFRHMLIADTAYAMIAPAVRRRLHADIAARLEADAAAEPVRPERLAWHFQEAGRTDRAITGWIAASRAALHRSARHEAIAFAEKGLALITEDTPDAAKRELDLQLCLAPALTALRGFGAEDVGRAYARARRLSDRVGTARTEVRVRVGLWIHSWVSGRLTESLGHADRLLELAETAGDPALRLQAHASRGQVLMHKGDLAPALHHLATGLEGIDAAPPTTLPAQNAAVSCAAYASWTAGMLGREEEARRFLDLSRRLAGLVVNPYGSAIHHALGAEPLLFLRDLEGCLDYANRAIALSREHDFAFWLGTGLVMRGWVLGQRGAEGASLEALDEGIAVFESTGAGVQLANWYGLKAETLLALGAPEAGIAAAEHALACAGRVEDVYFVPRIHATAARLHEALGAPGDAAAHRRTAATLASRMGMPATAFQG